MKREKERVRERERERGTKRERETYITISIIGGQIQGGPGQIGIPNYDWLLAWEAVTDESAGSSGDASLGHASLTWVARRFQAGFQSPWKVNYDWPLARAASPSFVWVASSLEACWACPGAADFLCRDLWKGEGYPGCCDLSEKGRTNVAVIS